MRGGNGLTADHRIAIQAARAAFGQTLLGFFPDDVVPLAMTAYSESFAELLIAAAGSGEARHLVGVANQALAPAGWQLVPVRRLPRFA